MSSHDFRRADRALIAVSGLLLLAVAVLALVREASPPWADAQARAREVVAERLGEGRVAAVPTGLRQIWIPELDRVDRCTTCHVTIDWGEELADAPNPVRSHPRPELLESHPPETFGCTLCHGGQGAATTQAAAHGNVPFWEEPLLDRRRAGRYELTPAQLLEMRCNLCHRYEAEVQGMPFLNAAKAEVAKRRCKRCHIIHGEGEARGPDLTRAGEKHASRFRFPEGWPHPRTTLWWHIEHLLDPLATSPESIMSNFGFGYDEAAGIALLVMSWRQSGLPAAWIPRPAAPASD